MNVRTLFASLPARLLLAAVVLSLLIAPAAAETVATVSPATAQAAMDRFVADHGGTAAIGAPLAPIEADLEHPGVYHRYYQNFQLDYCPCKLVWCNCHQMSSACAVDLAHFGTVLGLQHHQHCRPP